jgi:hypothetical protein
VVAICGSSRARRQITAANRILTLAGHLAYCLLLTLGYLLARPAVASMGTSKQRPTTV